MASSKLCLFLVIIAGFYLSAVNPWFLPESTDDIIYYRLAESHAAGEGHLFQGEIIGDWPPVWPLILSVPMRLGLTGVVVAKIVTIITAIWALWLAARLMRIENRPASAFSLILMALFPTAFAYAVRPSTDWIFAGLGFLFLLRLHGMREGPPSLFKALILGGLLGAAALTRMIGVLLGAAIVGQIFLRWWENKEERKNIAGLVRKSWPEMLAAVVGAAIWFGWNVYLSIKAKAGLVAKGNYDYYGSRGMWAQFEPLKLFEHISDLWFQFPNIASALGIENSPVSAVLLTGFAVVLGVGLWRRVIEGKIQPADFYVLATFGLLVIYMFKIPRYWICLSPFLLSWFFDGLGYFWKPVARKLPDRLAAVIPKGLGAVWVAGCVVICGTLVVRGNAHHSALSPLITQSEKDFYKGYYADLYLAAQAARSLEPAPARVGIQGWYANSFHVWSGGLHTYDWLFYPNDIEWFVTSPLHPQIPEEEINRPRDFKKIHTEGDVTIYRLKKDL